MRLPGGHGDGERVAVPTPGAAYALHVVLRRRRHLAEHHGGEFADVHAEFQRWRGGEHVRLPRLRIGGGEALLQAGAFVPLHQRGVLGGDDAADGGLAVELAEPRLLCGLLALVAVLGGEIQARHIAPEFRFGFRHHQRAAGSGAGQHSGVRGGVEAGGFQGVGGGVRGLQLGDQAGFY